MAQQVTVTNNVVEVTVSRTTVTPGVTGILAGTNIAVSPTNGIGNITVSVTGVIPQAAHAVVADTANGVAGANVTGTVPMAFLSSFSTTANLVSGSNVSGAVTFAQAAYAVDGANVNGAVATANVSGTVTVSAQPNITSVGTLTSLVVSGSITAPSFIGNISGSVDYANSANIANTANSVAGANVVGEVIYASIANLVAGGNVSGTVATANTAFHVTAANVSGNVNFANNAGNVTQNAQANITSVGTLTALAVSGVTTLSQPGNLHIYGGLAGQVLTTNGSGKLTWAPGAASPDHIANGTSSVNIPVTNGDILFTVDGGPTQMVLSTAGLTLAGTANLGYLEVNRVVSNLYPNANITYSLGTSTLRWKDLYLSGSTIYMDDSSIGSNATSVTISTPNNVSALAINDTNVTIGTTLIANNATIGNLTVTGNLDLGNITIDDLAVGNLDVSGTSNLNAVSNVIITGGSTGQALTTNGSGNLSWATVSSPPGGANTQIQFNDDGAFNGTANVVWNGAISQFRVDTDTISLGKSAGEITQGTYGVAVGAFAGSNAQGSGSMAIGAYAGSELQGQDSVAVGTNAGFGVQGANAVAVGYGAGSDQQGANAVALGYLAGSLNQPANSIILNATGAALNASTTGLFIAPIQQDTANITNIVYYNTTSKEITYGAVPSIIANGDSNVSIPVANGNVYMSSNGQANIMVMSSNGTHAQTSFDDDVTIAGNLSVTGNVIADTVTSNTANTKQVNVPYANTNAYAANVLVLNGNTIYKSMGAITAGTAFAIGNTGATWSVAKQWTAGSKTWYCDPISGLDSNDGSINAPFRTIARAQTVISNNSGSLYLQPGTYSENVIWTATNININGVGFGASVNLTGTWRFDSLTSSNRVYGVTFTNLTHSGPNNLYLNLCTVNLLSKTTASYLELLNCNTQNGTATITGTGSVQFLGGYQSAIVINNASAAVGMVSAYSTGGITLSAGTLTITGTTLIGLTTTSNVITAAAGSVLFLSGGTNVYNSALAVGRISTAGFWAINGASYDKTNSTFTGATNLGSTAFFDNINVLSTITATGNVTAANLSTAGKVSGGSANFIGASNVSLGNVANLKISGGTMSYVLSTDGASNLSWVAQGGGGGLPSGSNTQIQFNDAGFFGGNANLTFNKTTSNVNITGNLIVSGTVTGTTTSGFAIGYLGLPQTVQTANVTLALTDQGKHIYNANNAVTLTVPSNANVAFPIGAVVTVLQTGTNVMTISPQAGVTFNVGSNTAATGDQTVNNNGIVTLVKVDTNTWMMSSGGLVPVSGMSNGSSNVNIATGAGNIVMAVNGNAAIMTVSGVGANIVGTANISGNVDMGSNLTVAANIAGNTAGFTIGYRDVPQIAWTANLPITITDGGKHYYSTLAGNSQMTIANNVSVALAIGTEIQVINRGAGNILLAQGTGVSLMLAGNSAASGNRTVNAYGVATLLKLAANSWVVSGTGLV